MWIFCCLLEAVALCNMFPGRCSKTLRAAWTWMGSFLLSTAKTAAKLPPTTSSSCWPTSGSESSPLFCYYSECLVTVAQNMLSSHHTFEHVGCVGLSVFFKWYYNTTLKKFEQSHQLHFVVVLNFLSLIRPEKSKLQTIPGQLNVTIECVPPDFSSMLSFLNTPLY